MQIAGTDDAGRSPTTWSYSPPFALSTLVSDPRHRAAIPAAETTAHEALLAAVERVVSAHRDTYVGAARRAEALYRFCGALDKAYTAYLDEHFPDYPLD